MKFSEWLLKEEGYIYFKKPMKIDIGEGPQRVTAIDLQLQNMPKAKWPGDSLSLQTARGWINASRRYEAAPGWMYFDVESLTAQPKYQPFDGWTSHSIIVGNENDRIDRNTDYNAVTATG